MTTVSTLDVIYENWRVYHEKLRHCIAPLTSEQFLLQPAAHMWSVGQIVQHIISVRAGWFSGTLQDDDEAMNAYMGANGSHPPAAARNWRVVWMRRGPLLKPVCSAGLPKSAPKPSRMNGRVRCGRYRVVG